MDKIQTKNGRYLSLKLHCKTLFDNFQKRSWEFGKKKKKIYFFSFFGGFVTYEILSPFGQNFQKYNWQE